MNPPKWMNYPEIPDSWKEQIREQICSWRKDEYISETKENYFMMGYAAGHLVARLIMGFNLPRPECLLHKNVIKKFKKLIKEINATRENKYICKLEYYEKNFYIATIEIESEEHNSFQNGNS